MEKHNPGRRPVTMAQGIKEAAHALLQRGSKMRTRAPDHLSPVRDMTCVYDTGCGKRKRSDARGVTTRPRARVGLVEYVSIKLYKFEEPAKETPMEKASVCTS